MQGVRIRDLINWVDEIKDIPREDCNIPPFFLKPYHLVTLGLSVKKMGKENFSLPKELENYAARMQLWEALDMPSPRAVTKCAANGRFLPVEQFHKNKRNVSIIIDRLMEVINKNTSKNNQESLNVCLQEIINNFFDHANSQDLPCLVCAQSWPKGNLVQIAIADAGIGIRATLKENIELYTDLAKHNACELASSYGITGKPNSSHSGYGLTLASDLMHKSAGNYILFSGNEIFSRQQEHRHSIKSDSSWDGTLLILEWDMTKDLDVASVYNNWPLPSGFKEDDFF